MSLVRQLADSIFAVVFPSSCLLCGHELAAGGHGLCDECWSACAPWTGAACSRCGLPLATTLEGQGFVCGECRRDSPHFDGARSYGLYRGALRGAILELKFHRRERLGFRLGSLLAVAWSGYPPLGEALEPVLVPVPLHRARRRQRGYNQAEALARGLARELGRRERDGVPVEVACLLRTKATPPQTGLSFRARLENVRGAFEVAAPERVRGRLVVMVDDVMTTGATLSACAAALKRAGAAQVLGLTLARATPQFPDLIAQPTA